MQQRSKQHASGRVASQFLHEMQGEEQVAEGYGHHRAASKRVAYVGWQEA